MWCFPIIYQTNLDESDKSGDLRGFQTFGMTSTSISRSAEENWAEAERSLIRPATAGQVFWVLREESSTSEETYIIQWKPWHDDRFDSWEKDVNDSTHRRDRTDIILDRRVYPHRISPGSSLQASERPRMEEYAHSSVHMIRVWWVLHHLRMKRLTSLNLTLNLLMFLWAQKGRRFPLSKGKILHVNLQKLWTKREALVALLKFPSCLCHIFEARQSQC